MTEKPEKTTDALAFDLSCISAEMATVSKLPVATKSDRFYKAYKLAEIRTSLTKVIKEMKGEEK